MIHYPSFIVTDISEAVVAAIEPFMDEMRSRLDTIKNELTRIEEKVEAVNEDFEETKNQTTSDIVRLQNIFNESLTSLSEQFWYKLASVDARIMDEHREMESQVKSNLSFELDKINLKLDLLSIHQDRLDAKVMLVNSELEQSVLTNLTRELQMTYSYGPPTQFPTDATAINATLGKQFRVIANLLEKHNEDTMNQFDELNSPSHEQLTETLVSVNSTITKHVSWIKEDLDSLNDTINTFINLTKPPNASCDGGYTCGGEGGWRRAVYLNMTDPTTSCPFGWQLITFPKRTCGGVTGRLSCDSVFFPVTGGDYNRVCGRIKAYQVGYIDAFEAYDEGQATTIDGAYVAGVSLTHGSPRQHIWTFAAGATEAVPTRNDACPCDATINIAIPPFVGECYFCESGVNFGSPGSQFYPDDPLWDGENCTSTSTCCEMNNPPYFTKQLTSPTTDDIEARLCRYDSGEDSPVEFIELYVKGPSDGECIDKQDPIELKIDEVAAILSKEHEDIREDIEEHVNHVNSELIELDTNQDDIDAKLDSLDTKQDELNMKVMSFSSELQDTKDMLIELINGVCLGSGDIPFFPEPEEPGYTCGGEGGWRRVVYFDMTDPNTNCPTGWQLVPYTLRTCGKVTTGSLTCDSVFFPVTGGDYTRVCGSIIAYQHSQTDAFETYHLGEATTIDGPYVSGVSLTHGSPRQHIWTFAAGATEDQPTWNDACPCDATIVIAIPPFVSEDYFCESGVNFGSPGSQFYPDDPLWDGENCTSTSTCCSFNDPPYFIKQLPFPTSDNIEARLCWWDSDDDSPIEFMEIYVK